MNLSVNYQSINQSVNGEVLEGKEPNEFASDHLLYLVRTLAVVFEQVVAFDGGCSTTLRS